MHTLISPLINLVILISFLVIKLRAPLRDWVHSRHLSLAEALKNARDQLGQAQVQYEEFSAKLKAVDAEVAALRTQAKQDAEGARNRVVAEAKHLSTTIISDARLSAEGLVSDLKRHLSTEFGRRVIDRAERLLMERLTGDDRARIRQEFSSQVASASEVSR